MRILLIIVVIFAFLALIDAQAKVKAKTCITKCTKNMLGYFQSCDSCEAYVTCVFRVKYDRKCPGTLKWNDKTKECDFITPTCEKI
ncbi:uncharacterized protein LOC143045209 [Mytilus galloprovincialis]|uniref:uncharacterized protein LOC143045209 n=1 Tax=Mytilus galloprovincialis TaxID=29158 RepID=UPI003F7CAE80